MITAEHHIQVGSIVHFWDNIGELKFKILYPFGNKWDISPTAKKSKKCLLILPNNISRLELELKMKGIPKLPTTANDNENKN